jgi:DNA-binding PadR family transcriptional regulator
MLAHMRDESSMILMLLNQKNQLSLKEIKEDFYKFASQFGYGITVNHEKKHPKQGKDDFFISIEKQIHKLEKENLVFKKDEKYQLTEAGKTLAEKSQEEFDKPENLSININCGEREKKEDEKGELDEKDEKKENEKKVIIIEEDIDF